MKRTDFINLVVKKVDFDISPEDVERVLDVMESIGISPLNVCINPDGIFDSAKYAAHFHMHKDTHYWEPE